MKLNDEEYLKHFYSMVMQGISQGLLNPKEYIRSYSRCIGLPYTEIPKINEFILLVTPEIFCADFCLIGIISEEDKQLYTKWLIE